MISKADIKYINSLKLKKFRQADKKFIAEGIKIIDELVKSNLDVDSVYATKAWIENSRKSLVASRKTNKIIEITEAELKRISCLETPNEVLAIVNIPDISPDMSKLKEELVLMLDDIHDPGNLGTIIRIADWFGINNIICSENCVEVYNPKVIQSTMGSFTRVNCHYTNPESFLKSLSKETKIYGAILNGESIYTKQLSDKGIIIIGNESKGISETVSGFVNEGISIPYFPDAEGRKRAESLNASVATGIICAEFRRK